MAILLGELYRNTAHAMWAAGEAGMTFKTSNLIKPPEVLETPSLILKKWKHTYDSSFRVDAIDFFATKETYAYLGLLIMSSVFWPELFRIQLNLTNEASDIRYIVLDRQWLSETAFSGYHTQPSHFVYFPNSVQKHPWAHLNLARNHLPLLRLSNLTDWLSQETDWDKRDTIIGFGSDKATALFSELLLNISWPKMAQDEFHLECDAGFCGIAPCSAEAHFWLPGSFGWDCTIAKKLSNES